MKFSKSQDDLIKHLKEEIEFLISSSNSYDNGYTGEAKRLATTIRVLLHDTNKSVSLLKLLNKKNIKFYDTSLPFRPDNNVPYMGLVMMKMSGEGGEYVAPLDGGAPTRQKNKKLTFDAWWNEVVIVDKNKNKFKRRDIILTMVNKEGGAHIDPELDQAYADLSRFNSLGWTYSNKDVKDIPLANAELSNVRQITHEVLKSLHDEFPELFSKKMLENYGMIHYEKGLKLFKSGQIDSAINEFKNTIVINPVFAEVHCYLGISYGMKGLVKESIDELREAIRIKPDYADAHYNLGYAYTINKMVEEALAEYRQTIKLNSNYFQAYNNLGILLEQNGQNSEAIYNYREAIRIKPDYADAHNSLGSILGRQGDLSEAIKELKAAIKINPNYDKAHYNLGVAYFIKDQIDDAINELTEALRINPNYTNAKIKLDQCHKIKSI